MLIFRTIHNVEVAVNPSSISSIVNPDQVGENGSPVLDLHMDNGRVYCVYYADFQALVRVIEEKTK